jgi:hypothetical protein
MNGEAVVFTSARSCWRARRSCRLAQLWPAVHHHANFQFEQATRPENACPAAGNAAAKAHRSLKPDRPHLGHSQHVTFDPGL